MSLNNISDDGELVQLLKRGDHHAFTEIYNRYWDLLYIHSLKMLGDEQEAKDLIQDLFVSLWTKAHELEIKANLIGYLFVATRHRILNRIRQKKNYDNFAEALANFAPDKEVNILDVLTAKEIEKALDDEIQKLPTKMRAVFELSRKGYLSYNEIATELDISDRTVKKQISNALKIIRPRLNKFKVISLFF